MAYSAEKTLPVAWLDEKLLLYCHGWDSNLDLPHNMTMSNKVARSYPLGHAGEKCVSFGIVVQQSKARGRHFIQLYV